MLEDTAPVEAPAPVTYDTPLGDDIDRLYALKEAAERADEAAAEKWKVYDEFEARLFARMDNEKTTLSRGGKARASVKEAIVAKVVNWDEFYRFIGRNKAFHLLQRRVSDPAYRELLEQRKNGVPGVEPFTKRSLSVTKA